MKKLLLALPLFALLGGCSFNQAGQDAVDRLSNVSLVDIDQAHSLAFLNRNEPAMQCLDALKAVVIHLHSFHTVGAVTTFQMGLDITDPNGYLNQACLAYRQQVKDRVQLFLGKGATIAANFGL